MTTTDDAHEQLAAYLERARWFGSKGRPFRIEGTRRLGEVLTYEAGVLETFGTVPDLGSDRVDQGSYSGPGPNQT